MSEEERKDEKAIDEAIDNVPDKPENNPDASTEPTGDTGDTKVVEPLYQKKVYAIDLKSLGIKVEGEELIVDVMSIDKGKAKIECGQVKCEVPKDFLF